MKWLTSSNHAPTSHEHMLNQVGAKDIGAHLYGRLNGGHTIANSPIKQHSGP
jgi:hypothetical protein